MLAQIMKEVAEEARESSKRVLDELFEKMRLEAHQELEEWVKQNKC
jgi:hypothetical protein